MDENYLDSLLNEVSLDKEIDHKIEEELDNQIRQEKRMFQEQQKVSDEELFNMDLELDSNDVQTELDYHFSEEQMDELDQLDQMADLDIGDLDFSDIDFNDLDVTNLSGSDIEELDDLLKDFEGDLDISGLFDEEGEVESDLNTSLPEQEEDITLPTDDQSKNMNVVPSSDLNVDSFDTEQFLDSLLEDEEPNEEEISEIPQDVIIDNNSSQLDSLGDDDYDLLKALEEFEGGASEKEEESPSQLTKEEEDGLDDILAMLDLDDMSDSSGNISNSTKDLNSFDIDMSSLDGLEDFEDFEEFPSQPKDKKQKLMELIFGEPDEDDILSEEELAEIEAKKAAKKAAKDQKKEEKRKVKEEKVNQNSEKKKEKDNIKLLKAQKKQLLKEEARKEAANEKKLNLPAVIFIFTLFIGATILYLMSVSNFNYTQAIEKATNYFANQKYRKAYDQIVGVEVKKDDEDLKDRIYTVMYVERLYESYLNNIELGRYEKALDSLLRGVSKYYEHYNEAQELGIVSDIDFSFEQIKQALLQQYGITVEMAVEMNQLPDYEYVHFVESTVEQQMSTQQSENVEQALPETEVKEEQDAQLEQSTSDLENEKKEEDTQ